MGKVDAIFVQLGDIAVLLLAVAGN